MSIGGVLAGRCRRSCNIPWCLPAVQEPENPGPYKEASGRDSGAVFVVPLSGARGSGPIAVWLLAAGWAEAAKRILGSAVVVTPQGLMTAAEIRELASRPSLASLQVPPQRSLLETRLRTAGKDLVSWTRARRWRQTVAGLAGLPVDVAFVWQHHQAFHDAGFRLAERYGRPLVLHVDAPVVWEASRWGVARPGWGRWVERFGELPQMHRADLVTCPSEEVAEEVRQRGVEDARVMVTPGGVDVQAFHPGVSGQTVRRQHGLEGKLVVGWTGSFRRFHGLDTALEAFAELQRQRPATALLLVGDGFERQRLEHRATELELRNVVFTGTVAHQDMPRHVAAMDVAVVLAPVGQGFHYSPMKLREYMSSGRAVVAARVGEISRFLADGSAAVLVAPNDTVALTRALVDLHDQPEKRQDLGSAARRRMEDEGSWDRQLMRVVEALRCTTS